MDTKSFIKRIIARVLIFGILMFLVSVLFQAMAPVINNDIAMTQMQNTDASLILMETYEKIKPLATLAKTLIIAWFSVTITHDTYKFVKHNEKEN